MKLIKPRIRRLFISPAHNYFGHHGDPSGKHPAIEVGTIECVAGRGIRGDRFFDFKPDYKGQITFFAAEILQPLAAALAIAEIDPSSARRNVLVEEMDLPALIGVEFEIQGIRFFGTEECRPCYWMNEAFGHGAEDFLKGRGGLRARILTDGILRRS